MFLLSLDISNSGGGRGAKITGVTDDTFELVIIVIVNRLKAGLL